MNGKSHSPRDFTPISYRIISHLSETWHISDCERDLLLGDSTGLTWSMLRSSIEEESSPDLDNKTLRRVSYLFRINRALEQLFDTTENLIEFLHSPNRDFASRTPLALMCDPGESGLATVHTYLYRQC